MSRFIFFLTGVSLIVMGSITLTTLVTVKMVISRLLRKIGYHPNNSRKVYQQIQSDLKQTAADLTDIRIQLDEVEPYIRDMEFLKYAERNDKVE